MNYEVNEFGYFKDNVDLGELRSAMENICEKNKVLDLADNSSNVMDVGDGAELHINKETSNSLITATFEEGMDTLKPREVSANTVSCFMVRTCWRVDLVYWTWVERVVVVIASWQVYSELYETL